MASTLTSNAWHLARSIAQPGSEATIAKLFDVRGWVCVVTGGGTGLGLTAAIALAQNGAKVYIVGRRLDVHQEAAAEFSPKSGMGKLIPLRADMTKKEDIKGLVEQVRKTESYVNLLINNHGTLGPMRQGETDFSVEALSRRALEGDSFEAWDDTFKINVTSHYFSSYAFLPLLAAAKSIGRHLEPGNIIQIGSDATEVRSRSAADLMAYTCSKAAQKSLMKMMAAEFATRGHAIRVNSIGPGAYPSGMNDFDPEWENRDPEAFSKHIDCPLRRLGAAADHANVLLSVATNRYMTGACITVDGGSHLT